MELKTKPRPTTKVLNRDEPYHYSYKFRDGRVVKFYGDDEIKKDFIIRHYANGGTLYYRK